MQINRALATRLAITAIALSSVSCGSQRATYAPDGRRGFAVRCTGFFNSWSNCLVKAGRACGNHGYDLIEGSPEDRSMLIACK